jgi:hypothetical protein
MPPGRPNGRLVVAAGGQAEQVRALGLLVRTGFARIDQGEQLVDLAGVGAADPPGHPRLVQQGLASKRVG